MVMDTSWAGQYIGTPWEKGGEGPQAYSCWGFFRMVQTTRFGIAVPAVHVDVDDDAALLHAVSRHPEGQRWEKVSAPRHGDAVIVHRPLHIGIWIDYEGGGVLHCVRGIGVIFTPGSAWASSGFGRREYRRIKNSEGHP